MKFDKTVIHVIHDEIDGEFLIQFSYDPEEDRITFYGSYGKLAILNGIDFETIIRGAIVQETYVRYLDGEFDKEVAPEDNHIYYNVSDYVMTNFIEESNEENKQLKTR